MNFRFISVMLFVVSPLVSLAQVDAPPLEPPYTNSEPNFDGTENVIDLNKTDRSNLVPNRDSAASSEFIEHPNAKKGLYLIDSKNVYHYKTTLITQKQKSIMLTVGAVPIPNLTFTLSNGEVFDFADMYGDSAITQVTLNYEWKLFKGMKQLFGQAGFGFYSANGSGYFYSKNKDNPQPREKYTFYGLPMNLGLSYRFQYSDHPWFTPYIAGGGIYYVMAEIRDDGRRNSYVGTPAGYASGGLLINLTAWSRELQFRMDREYGINNLWLVAEIKAVQASSEDLDITSQSANFGFSVDY